MKSIIIALLMLLVAGCSENADGQAMSFRDVYAGEEHGIMSLTDTSAICYWVERGDTTMKLLYTFAAENSSEAYSVMQMSLVPVTVLNPAAFKEYVEGLKYIKSITGLRPGRRKR